MASFTQSLCILFILLLKLFIGTNCAIIGMKRPIEVVEEQGCHHTEFRLTCGNLESQLAILEATFTAECSHAGDAGCTQFDKNRLTRKIDSHIIEESEAGRKFLETLRKNEMHEEDTVSVVKVDASVSNQVENKHSNVFVPKQDERVSLRSRLERLLVTYLKKLTSDREDGFSENLRNRRNINNLTSASIIDLNQNSTDTFDNFTSTTLSESIVDNRSDNEIVNGDYDYNESNRGESDKSPVETDKSARIILGEKDIVVEAAAEDVDDYHSPASHPQPREKLVNKMKLECSDKKKNVLQLNRLVLEESFTEKDNEYNLRNVLNYRCSGKNHCSFIFSSDHYMAKELGNGTIRIKYICMDDFRIMRYCMEHLLIGNELTQLPLPEDRKQSRQQQQDQQQQQQLRGEPKAEARVNSNIMAFHQFTNLKILKPSTTEDEEEVEAQQKYTKDKERMRSKAPSKQQIYSQDFTLLKVLPSNVDPLNDIHQVGDEFYFKKDEEDVTTNDVDQRNLVTQQTTSTSHSSRDDGDDNAVVVPSVRGRGRVQDEKTNAISDNEIAPIVFANDKINKIDRNTSNVEQIQLSSFSSTHPSPTVVSSTSTRAASSPALPTSSAPARSTSTSPAATGPTSPSSTEYEIIIREGDEYITTFPDLITTRVSSTHKTPDINLVTAITTQWEKEILANYPNILEDTRQIANESSATLSTPHASSATSPFTHTSPYLPPAAPTLGTVKDVENIENEIDGNDVNERLGETGRDKAKDDLKESAKIQNPFIYDIADTDEDYDEEYDDADGDGYRKSQNRKYTSIQRTAFRKPLLQGFAMTPGYPQFYIGGSDCKWTITVPGGQKIRISILDISLRYDHPCQDYLEIIDSETNTELFSSCTESDKPLEIISESNQLQITLKTETDTAYPKRGVLFHYAALGCVVPFTPAHVSVVERTEEHIKYACEPSYVFPDSAVVNRDLYCAQTHTWDKTLPDCIEETEAVGSGLVLQFEEKLRKNPKMVDEADTLYDIVIPSFIIASLFVVNGLVLAFILRYRNKRKQCLEFESKELAEL